MRKLLILVITCLLPLFLVASASAYFISYVDGTTYNTTAIDQFSTDSADMNGMTVTATFLGGATDTQIWNSGVTGTGWGLSVGGDTYNNYWPLSLSVSSDVNLASLSIDAGTGDTVFDVVDDFGSYYPGSPNSANGYPFYTSSTAYINATYSDRVTVNNVFYGDLYRTLTLDFGSNGLSSGFSFRADTDNLQIEGDLNPVPEPSTILLMGAGLLGLVGYNRKRFSKKS